MYDGPNTTENYFSLVKSEMGVPGQRVAVLAVVTWRPRLFVRCALLYSTFGPQGYQAHWHQAVEVESMEDCIWEVFTGWAESGTQLLKFQR